MKSMVTGGAGFIGSELVRQLVAAGHFVVVVDNLVNGKRENLDGVDSTRATFVQADVRDARAMENLVEGIDVVYHLACLGVRHSIHSPQENHDVNASATLQLLTLSRRAGVRRFVYVSSSEVYGTALWVPMTEEHPAFPMTVYGASKLAGECYARAFWQTYRFPTVVVRPFNAYGPRCHHEGDSGEVIPKFLLRCLAKQPMIVFGDGSQTRDFTFVSDTAAGILRSGVVDDAVGETINLGSGSEISIAELTRIVAEVVGVTAEVEHDPPRPGDVLRLYAASDKARRLLSFHPQVTIDDGLRRLKDWYMAGAASPGDLLQQEIRCNWEGPDPATIR